MPCPVCRHTMHNLGASTDRIFWCPRCGCILTYSGNIENISPTRISRDAADAKATYVYSFVPWPCELGYFPKELFDLFRVFTRRVEMEFTEQEFELFRSRLSHVQFTLREVARRPAVKLEPVE